MVCWWGGIGCSSVLEKPFLATLRATYDLSLDMCSLHDGERLLVIVILLQKGLGFCIRKLTPMHGVMGYSYTLNGVLKPMEPPEWA